MYTVYIRTDEQGRVEDVSSSAFLVDPAGWMAVCSGDGDRFVHAQGNFFAKLVRDERGICQYRKVKADAYTAGEDRVVASFESEGIPYVLYERTEEEMKADEQPAAAGQSDAQRLAALEEELRAAKILLGLEV